MIDINKVRVWSVRFIQTHTLQDIPFPSMIVEEIEGPGYAMPQYAPRMLPQGTGGQITLTLEGRGCLQVKDDLFSCTPGTAFLYRDCDPDVSYFFPQEETTPWRFLWINFVGMASETLIANINQTYGYFFATENNWELAKRLKAFQNRSGTVLSMTSLEGAHLAFELFETLCRQCTQGILAQPSNQLVKAVQLEVSQTFGESLSHHALAKKFGVSREHLSKVFHAETGQTLQDYIAEYKLSNAMDLLLKSNLSCKEIAQRCQYGSYSSFFRAFTKAYGQSPDNFRQHDDFR